MSARDLETLARKPWLAAEGDTWWSVTGKTQGHGQFIDCVARVVPTFVTGEPEGTPVFEVMLHGGSFLALADAITHARQLELVEARDWDRAREQLRTVRDLCRELDVTGDTTAEELAERVLDVVRWVD